MSRFLLKVDETYRSPRYGGTYGSRWGSRSPMSGGFGRGGFSR